MPWGLLGFQITTTAEALVQVHANRALTSAHDAQKGALPSFSGMRDSLRLTSSGGSQGLGDTALGTSGKGVAVGLLERPSSPSSSSTKPGSGSGGSSPSKVHQIVSRANDILSVLEDQVCGGILVRDLSRSMHGQDVLPNGNSDPHVPTLMLSWMIPCLSSCRRNNS